MLISNKSSSQLGFSVAAAMSIHNLMEGFLIALPLYYATGSQFAAFSYAAILGGMSQPIGAVLGLLAISNVDSSQERFLFGVVFGVVSGMMCFIAVQVRKKARKDLQLTKYIYYRVCYLKQYAQMQVIVTYLCSFLLVYYWLDYALYFSLDRTATYIFLQIPLLLNCI
jgi:uncharacterized membrane protein YfcA